VKKSVMKSAMKNLILQASELKLFDLLIVNKKHRKQIDFRKIVLVKNLIQKIKCQPRRRRDSEVCSRLRVVN
jgi:hypothetical protein